MARDFSEAEVAMLGIMGMEGNQAPLDAPSWVSRKDPQANWRLISSEEGSRTARPSRLNRLMNKEGNQAPRQALANRTGDYVRYEDEDDHDADDDGHDDAKGGNTSKRGHPQFIASKRFHDEDEDEDERDDDKTRTLFS